MVANENRLYPEAAGSFPLPSLWWVGLVVLGALSIGLVGCEKSGSSTQLPSQSAVVEAYRDRPRLEGSAEVAMQVRTARAGRGTLVITLAGEDAPLTAGHFADLVRQGFYSGMTFFRVEKDPEPFVVHAGEAGGTDSPLGTVSPQPLSIPLEIKLKDESTPRYNALLEMPTISDQLVLPHRLGAVAMARSSALDSASHQFYISLSALPILDGRFAVFGYVTEGMTLVDQIEVGDVIESAWIRKGGNYLVYPQLEQEESLALPAP